MDEIETRDSRVDARLREEILKEVEFYNKNKQQLYDFIGSKKLLTNNWLDTHFRKSSYQRNRWVDSYDETVTAYRGSLWLWFLNQKRFRRYFFNNTRFLSIELHLDQLSSSKGEAALAAVLSGHYGQAFEKLQRAIQHEMTSVVSWITFNWFFRVFYQVQIAVAYSVKANLDKAQFAAFKNRVAVIESLELAVRAKFSAHMGNKDYFDQDAREKMNVFLADSTAALAVLSEKDAKFSALYQRARRLTNNMMRYHMTVKGLSIAQENILRIETAETHGTTNAVMKEMFKEKSYAAVTIVIGYLSRQANQAVKEGRTHPIKRYKTALQVFTSRVVVALATSQTEEMSKFFDADQRLLDDMDAPNGQCESNLRLMYGDICDIFQCFTQLRRGVFVSDRTLHAARDQYNYLKEQHAVGKALTKQLEKTLLYAEERVEEGKPDKSTVSCAAYLMNFGSEAQREMAINYISPSLGEPEPFVEEEKQQQAKGAVRFSKTVQHIPRGKK